MGSMNNHLLLNRFWYPGNAERFNPGGVLGVDEQFYGTAKNFTLSRLKTMIVAARSDKASAAEGFRVQQSHNGITWYNVDVGVQVGANITEVITCDVAMAYARVAYLNGGTATEYTPVIVARYVI